MKKYLSRFVTNAAGRLGYTVLPTWRVENHPLENHLKALFARYSIDTVFDVGANRGQYRDFVRNCVDFGGEIHSFEPVSYLGDELARRTALDPKWHLHRHAVGSENAVLEINVTARDTFSSLREPKDDETSQFAASTVITQREKVQVVRLDDVWQGLHAARPESIYLKIDTQGFDIEVMRGARELMRSVPALQFELSVRPIYQGTPHYLEMLRQVDEWGFDVSGLFPINTDADMRAVEFDCVMVARGR